MCPMAHRRGNFDSITSFRAGDAVEAYLVLEHNESGFQDCDNLPQGRVMRLLEALGSSASTADRRRTSLPFATSTNLQNNWLTRSSSVPRELDSSQLL